MLSKKVIAVNLFLIFFFNSILVQALTCEENRAQIANYFATVTCTSNQGCHSGPGWQRCISYSGVTTNRLAWNSDEAECTVTDVFDTWDADPNDSYNYPPTHEVSTFTNRQNIPVCPGQPQLPSSPSGPPGGGSSSSSSSSSSSACSGVAPGSVKKTGSIIYAEAQSFAEVVPVVGSAISLYYYSGFQAGRNADFTVNYVLSGATPRDYISGFIIENRRNGVLIDTATISNTANQSYQYAWDGLDPSSTFPVDSAIFDLTVKEVSPTGTVGFTSKSVLGHFNVMKLGLGGWAPSVQFYYDVLGKRLFSATGTYTEVEAKPYGTSQLYVASEDGSRVYIFDLDGKHLFTKTGFLGTNIYSFGYDTSGRLSTITQPFGLVTTFNRNSSGELTSITAPKGEVTSIGLNTNGFISSVTNPRSEVYQFTYLGTNGLMSTFEKPNGEVSTFTYTSNGLLAKDAHSGGYFLEMLSALNTAQTYDLTLTTALGRTSKILSNVTNGKVIRSETSAAGVASYTNYGKTGTEYVRSDSSDGIYTTMTSVDDARFGGMSKFLKKSDVYLAGGGTSRLIESAQTITLSTPSDPFSIATWTQTSQISGEYTKDTTTFDPVTKKFSNSSYLGKTSEWVIDTYERPVSFKIGNQNAFSYGYTNENLTSIGQGTRSTTISYNSLGLLESITNPLSQTTGFIYDSANRLSSKVFADSRVVGYSYDAVGNTTGVTPPGRPIHSFTINSQGTLGGYQPPTLTGVSTVNTTYSYNLDKQLTNITRPSGQYVNYNYNTTTGLLSNYVTGEGTYTIYYYSNGMIYYIGTPSGVSIALTYVGPYVSETNWNVSGMFSAGFKKTFGAKNRITSDTVQRYWVNSTVSYLYNEDGDLQKAGELELAYNVPDGQLTGTQLGMGTTGFSDSYTYNTYGEVTGYEAKQGTTTIYQLGLTRDGSGRINAKSQSMNGTTDAFGYTFDSVGRLTQVSKNSVVAANYGYDSNSNRNSGNVGAQTTTATYDNQDRLTAYNTLTFTYNANGDLLTKTNTTTSTTTQYAYDVFGNLKSVTLPSGDVISYEFDALNRRVGKNVNGVSQKRWVYMDQYRIAAEFDAAGDIDKRFVYGSKGNIPDYMIVAGEKYRIISDHLGSPRLVVKQSDGTVVQRMDHDEYGRVTADTNPGYLPFGFAGGLYDNQTGIVRFGARDYDPETGRWTSKDPILFGGRDANLYGYTFNDPVNFIDPSGLKIDDRTDGNIPAIVRNSPIYKYLDSLPNEVVITNGIVPGKPSGRGTTNSTFYGCNNEIIINPANRLSDSDLIDSYFHELSHAAKNIQFGGRTSVKADHSVFGPIDAAAGNFGGRSYGTDND